ncbi:unnamed protein product, partial [marine sediment metagenome]
MKEKSLATQVAPFVRILTWLDTVPRKRVFPESDTLYFVRILVGEEETFPEVGDLTRAEHVILGDFVNDLGIRACLDGLSRRQIRDASVTFVLAVVTAQVLLLLNGNQADKARSTWRRFWDTYNQLMASTVPAVQ